MSNIYEKFNDAFNASKLAKEVKELESGNTQADYKEVPVGSYEVKIEKMDLKESKTGKPMVSIWFKILAGEFKNSVIFMNQILVEPFQLHIVKEFLKSLDSGMEVDFESYTQFHNLLLDIHEAINGKLEYALEYSTDKNGYGKYKITEVFDAQ